MQFELCERFGIDISRGNAQHNCEWRTSNGELRMKMINEQLSMVNKLEMNNRMGNYIYHSHIKEEIL